MAAFGRVRFVNALRNPRIIQCCNLHIWKRLVASPPKRFKATTVVLSEDYKSIGSNGTAKTSKTIDPAFSKIDISFENAQEAYKSKTNFEVLRTLLVFNLCSIRLLVDHNKKIMKLARQILGRTLFVKIMKSTFYGQFVAGEDEIRIKPTVERNRSFGVKSILDYSVEKDISKEEAKQSEMEACVPEALDASVTKNQDVRFQAHEQFGDRREGVTAARTYFYEDEEQCDENMEVFLRSIDCVSGATNATGFAAIKMTALGRPQLLLQLSEVLARVRRHFDVLSAATGNELGKIKQKDFERYLKRIITDPEERRQWFTVLDVSKDGVIDLLDWHNLLEVNVSLAKLLRVPNVETGKFEPLVAELTEEEEESMKNMLHRLDTIAKYGKEKDVRVMVDAEQTYFQPAINRLTVEMMRKYNKEKAIIFNTYQCYLKDAYNMITTDLALSQRENFHFGAKLVRGAYMEQERKRALTLGYEDPIMPSFDATTKMYEKVLTKCMEEIQSRERGKVAIMIASHNEETVRFTLNKMQEMGIYSTDKVICFGQLLGMCDQVSFSLGQAGYSVYKYVPYGPVEEVLPYLSRRAVENRGILKKVKKEKMMLKQELSRRLLKGQFFYTPTPPAVDPLAPIVPPSTSQNQQPKA